MSESPVDEKTVVLGITGGIAAYKTPALIRQLRNVSYRVIPVLTRAAKHFVTSHALAAVSDEKVRDDLWDEDAELAMGHIELARRADILLIAPATAHVIGKLANGLADDLLSTVYLATQAQVVIAPAMNQQMYLSDTVQSNLQRLREIGVIQVGPGVGDQACGDFGPGRMSEPEQIAEVVEEISIAGMQGGLDPNSLAGKQVLVTAGPTREALDPVRYLSNASSGRQGFSIAQAARQRGADVTLIAGPVNLATPDGVQRVDVTTAHEMHQSVLQNLKACDLFFSVAAVADYTPRTSHSQKIKKSASNDDGLLVELEATVDIVKDVAQQKQEPFIVGFAAETTNVLQHAREKRIRKGLDAIVLNDVSKSEIGFESENNQVLFIHDEGEVEIPFGSKQSIAHQVLDEVIKLLPKVATETKLEPVQSC